MAYFPGPTGTLRFEKTKLVWSPDPGDEQQIPWAEIFSVSPSDSGATIEHAGGSLVVPKSIVWFEFVVEDMIAAARAANPSYRGPIPEAKPRELTIPSGHDAQLVYTRRAQRFYGKRCPSYEEFRTFLEANPNWVFDESSSYQCAMSMCSGAPVGEGLSTDLDIPKGYTWYHKLEKKAGGGSHSGKDLLALLKRA